MARYRRPRQKAPTSKDVAALAGVAQSTVSQVINGRSVLPDTKRRVEDAMRMLQYHPNAGARTLRTARTSVIALLVELQERAEAIETVPYINTIVEAARERDYDVILSTTGEGPDGLRRLIGRSICDAVVLMDIRLDDDRVPVASEMGRPAVLVGRPNEARGVDVVDFDSRRAAELLVDELVSTGHEQIVVLGEADNRSSEFRAMSEFYEGAMQRAKAAEIPLRIVTPQREDWNSVHGLDSEIFLDNGRRLGLIGRTPRATEHLLRLLIQGNREIGRSTSLVALCTDEVASSFEVPVTNISPEPQALARHAMELLFSRIDGEDSPGHLDLIEPTRVFRRESTAVFN
jgi:Transcriptional regulators